MTGQGRLWAWFERAVLAAGLLTLALLLWRFEPALIWRLIAQVGFGFLVIIPLQLFDHMLNALGWRQTFEPEEARSIPFWRLVLGRVAGDGVNYLTPSASIAGEFVRPGMLATHASEEAKNASVVIGKFTQAIGQAVFILVGMSAVVSAKLNFLSSLHSGIAVAMALAIIAVIGVSLYLLTSRRIGLQRWLGGSQLVSGIRERIRRYIALHPGRMATSVAFFSAGYAWGSIEVLVICHFMGLSVSPIQAVAIETFSNIIDSLLFMVPAKVGTQEAGKVAIFHGLGLLPSQGLAFGLIRHVRELFWAGTGLTLYAINRRASSGTPRLESRTDP
ncbi:MAG: flippase-like domain-containing protein [Elusimicrobia bacterium]|nr:flippase-like domain-containing protein [Elusimicrobiota bacterium]